jgi:hypothetical protein
MQRAEAWLAGNLGADQRLLIDQQGADDLLGRGITEGRVISVPTSGPLPEALAGWREYDYLVSSPVLRGQLGRLPSVQAALDSSMPVAAFGADADMVEIRRIVPGGVVDGPADELAARGLRLRAGGALASNPNVSGSPDALDALRSGQVDERLLNVLATYAVQHQVRIADFPAIDGEDDAGMPRRIATVDRVDGDPVAAGSAGAASLDAFLGSQVKSYRPASVAVDPPGTDPPVVRITYGVSAQPSGHA